MHGSTSWCSTRKSPCSIGDLVAWLDDLLEEDDTLSRALIPEVWQVARREGAGGRHGQEPRIPDGAYCLFASPVTGARQGRTVLVQLRDALDPDTGERFTVKRYRSEKSDDENGWRHLSIVLEPNNPEFAPIELKTEDEGSVAVVAELVEVIDRQSEPPAA